MPFTIGLDSSQVQKVVLNIFFFPHNYAKIENDLFFKKALTLHNVVILILVFNKDQSLYYHNIFLEKCAYQLDKK